MPIKKKKNIYIYIERERERERYNGIPSYEAIHDEILPFLWKDFTG